MDVERFRAAAGPHGRRLADRLFTDDERRYAGRLADPAPSLAARFAAKEATMKALGVGLGAFGWRDVEVVRAETGAPSLRAARARPPRWPAGRACDSWQHVAHPHRRLAEAVVAALRADAA